MTSAFVNRLSLFTSAFRLLFPLKIALQFCLAKNQ
jgi:hypothetical protein